MKHHPRQDLTNGMELELEGGDDAEVAPAAAHAPEKVRVLGGAGDAGLAVGGDDVNR